ncbi:MAG TPA: hypothetical protein VK622_00180, partial [Puia sp.]|nr:hypothetical protein [Puia sp.]
MTVVANNGTLRLKRITSLVLKTILWMIAIPLCILLIGMIVLQFPKTQTYLTGKATKFLSQKIKTRVELAGINIAFPKSISFHDIYIEDERSDTLFYAHSVKIDLNLWDLFSKKIKLNDVALETLTARVSGNTATGKFNFSFIPEAFASSGKDTVTKKKDRGPSW